MQLLNIIISYLLILRLCVIAQTGQEAFQITEGSKVYSTASDVFNFKAQSYTGSPWTLNIAQGNSKYLSNSLVAS